MITCISFLGVSKHILQFFVRKFFFFKLKLELVHIFSIARRQIYVHVCKRVSFTKKFRLQIANGVRSFTKLCYKNRYMILHLFKPIKCYDTSSYLGMNKLMDIFHDLLHYINIKSNIHTCYTITIYQMHAYLFYKSSFIHVFVIIIEFKLPLLTKASVFKVVSQNILLIIIMHLQIKLQSIKTNYYGIYQ